MSTIWTSFFWGAALLGTSVWAGWLAANYPAFAPVRAVDWWIRRVALPVLRQRTWFGRAAIIFGNNIAILTLLVALGQWPAASLVGVAVVGLSLGAAFHLLLKVPDENLAPRLRLTQSQQRRVRIGLALNMLEPPAILFAVTLSLAHWMAPLPPGVVWKSYLVWVAPAMLIAAGGEALWLAAGRDERPAMKNVSPSA